MMLLQWLVWRFSCEHLVLGSCQGCGEVASRTWFICGDSGDGGGGVSAGVWQKMLLVLVVVLLLVMTTIVGRQGCGCGGGPHWCDRCVEVGIGMLDYH
jgi:hypothetical protein